MKNTKRIFKIILFLAVILGTFSACDFTRKKAAETATTETAPSLQFDTTTSWRGPLQDINISPNYFVYITWKSEKENPVYKVEVKYSTEDAANNRAAVFTSDSPNAESLSEEDLNSYTGHSILIKDFQRDFNGLPDSYDTNSRNEKVYTITVSYADTIQHGNESIQLNVTRFLNPTSPHSEGDVIRPITIGGR